MIFKYKAEKKTRSYSIRLESIEEFKHFVLLYIKDYSYLKSIKVFNKYTSSPPKNRVTKWFVDNFLHHRFTELELINKANGKLLYIRLDWYNEEFSALDKEYPETENLIGIHKIGNKMFEAYNVGEIDFTQIYRYFIELTENPYHLFNRNCKHVAEQIFDYLVGIQHNLFSNDLNFHKSGTGLGFNDSGVGSKVSDVNNEIEDVKSDNQDPDLLNPQSNTDYNYSEFKSVSQLKRMFADKRIDFDNLKIAKICIMEKCIKLKNKTHKSFAEYVIDEDLDFDLELERLNLNSYMDTDKLGMLDIVDRKGKAINNKELNSLDYHAVNLKDLNDIFDFKNIENRQFVRLQLEQGGYLDIEFEGNQCNILYEKSIESLNRSRKNFNWNSGDDDIKLVREINQSSRVTDLMTIVLTETKYELNNVKINKIYNRHTHSNLSTQSMVDSRQQDKLKEQEYMNKVKGSFKAFQNRIELKKVQDEVATEMVQGYKIENNNLDNKNKEFEHDIKEEGNKNNDKVNATYENNDRKKHKIILN